jgi:hypothetical protein
MALISANYSRPFDSNYSLSGLPCASFDPPLRPVPTRGDPGDGPAPTRVFVLEISVRELLATKPGSSTGAISRVCAVIAGLFAPHISRLWAIAALEAPGESLLLGLGFEEPKNRPLPG